MPSRNNIASRNNLGVDNGMDKEELINDIETIKEMLEKQLQLIEILNNEVRKGQLILDRLIQIQNKNEKE